jgi:REP element-mobilizing transposase RayT
MPERQCRITTCNPRVPIHEISSFPLSNDLEAAMGSTYFNLRMHIVFSTKDRRQFIAESWRSSLHEYLGGTARGLGTVAEAIGGIEDHVHLLVSYRPTLVISDFVRELKKASSVWSIEKHEPQFGWQEGYSVFSVSASQKKKVAAYIENQAEHHRKVSSREELENFLRRHGIEYETDRLS